ncbi:MAG: radical SAM protein [Planctomycetota bacterium]|nr:radical SAM protein [Planctomycetota bacterium]
MIQRNKRVVLYFPHLADPHSAMRASRDLLPLSVLAIAGIPDQEGFEVVVIDGNLTPPEEGHRRLAQACEGALCLGTTSILGYQVTDGLQAVRRVKATCPDLPIIAGGWFPSVAPEMHLATGLFDAICVGQGELTFADFVRACDARTSIDAIPGLALLREGQVIRTAPRPVVGWDKLTNFPWHLLDIAPYRDSQLAGRPAREMEGPVVPPGHHDKPFFAIPYYSSFGCPEPCSFCSSPGVSGRRWKAMPAARMLDDLCDLHDRWGFDSLRFFDANFGVSQKRVKELAEGLIDRGHHFWWYALMQTDHVARYEPETLDVMRDCGMFCVQLGAETGDSGVMSSIGKHCPSEVNERAVERLAKRGVCTLATYVIGFPDETEEAMMRTIDQCERVASSTPLCRAMVWPFRPIPGTGMYPRSVELGFEPPELLEGWGDAGSYHLVQEEPWPDQISPRVAARRQVYEHFASLSVGLGKPSIGFWGRRAQRRVRERNYRNGRLEARLYTALDSITRRLRPPVADRRIARLSGYQTSILAPRLRDGERSTPS